MRVRLPRRLAFDIVYIMRSRRILAPPSPRKHVGGSLVVRVYETIRDLITAGHLAPELTTVT